MLFLLERRPRRKRMQRLGQGRSPAFERVRRFYADGWRILRVLVEQFNGDERGLEVDRCGKGYGRIVAGQQARNMSSLYKRSGCRVRNVSNSTARDRKAVQSAPRLTPVSSSGIWLQNRTRPSTFSRPCNDRPGDCESGAQVSAHAFALPGEC